MIRSAIVFLWLAVSLIPLASAIVICSPFISSNRLWWSFAVPWLQGVVACARIVAGVKYEVEGMENLPSAQSNAPIILCPKHQSTWETFAFPAMMPHPISYVFKKELLRIPFFGWAIGSLDMVHIDRGKGSKAWSKVAQQGRELMRTGHWIVMFPEGTRSERGSKGKYKSGATRLAVDTGASVVPIAVTSGRCWPRKTFRMTPGLINVSIGKPISSEGRKADELMKEVEAWIEAEMRRLDPEAY